MTDRAAATILCVEDEVDLLDDLICELREAGYNVVAASDGPSALSAVMAGGIDLVLCDVQLPQLDGMTIRRKLSEWGGDCPPFALMTAYSDSTLRQEAEALGIVQVIVKPIDYDGLLNLIPHLLQGDSDNA